MRVYLRISGHFVCGQINTLQTQDCKYMPNALRTPQRSTLTSLFPGWRITVNACRDLAPIHYMWYAWYSQSPHKRRLLSGIAIAHNLESWSRMWWYILNVLLDLLFSNGGVVTNKIQRHCAATSHRPQRITPFKPGFLQHSRRHPEFLYKLHTSTGSGQLAEAIWRVRIVRMNKPYVLQIWDKDHHYRFSQWKLRGVWDMVAMLS